MPVETKDTKADPLADLLASGNAELARRADEAAAKDKKDAETVAAEWRVVALLADDLLGPLAAFVPAEPPEDFAYALKRGEAYDAQIRPHKNGLAYIELMFVRDYNPATRGSAKPWAWRAVPAETATDDAGELANRFHVCARIECQYVEDKYQPVAVRMPDGPQPLDVAYALCHRAEKTVKAVQAEADQRNKATAERAKARQAKADTPAEKLLAALEDFVADVTRTGARS